MILSPGHVSLDGVSYRLATGPEGGGQPAVSWTTHGQDLFRVNRPDIIPGDLPGEFWWVYRGGSLGVGPTFYREPGHARIGNSSTFQTSGIETHFPGIIALAGALIFNKTHTDASPTDVGGFAEENSQLVFISGDTAWTVGAGNLASDLAFTTVDASATMFPPIIHMQSGVSRRVLYVGSGSTATGRIFRRSAGVWTNTVLRTELLLVGAEVLYRSYQDSNNLYQIQTCPLDLDPMTAANWGGTITVGDPSAPITGLAMDGEDLVIAKTNGLYTVSPTGLLFNWTKEVLADAFNGKGTASHLGYVLYPTIQGLVAFRQGRVYYNVGPEAQTDEVSQVGRCQAMTSRAGWIYAVFQGANVQRLMKARLRSQSDPPGGPFIWFPWTYNVYSETGSGTNRHAASISSLDIDGRTELMLWLGKETRVVSYFLFDEAEGDLDNGTSEAVTTLPASGTLVIPDDDFGFPGATKLFLDGMVIGRNLNATTTVTLVGAVTGGDTSTLTFTAERTLQSFGAQGARGTLMADIRLTLNRRTTGTVAVSPLLEAVLIRFFVRPNENRLLKLRLLVAEGLGKGEGVPVPGSGEGSVTSLLALSEAAATPLVTFRDETDTAYTLMVLPPILVERVLAPGREAPYYVVTLQAVER